MKKILKRILKILGGLIAVVCFAVILFIAFNFTLIKNLPSAQDGGADAMYIANQKPLKKVEGGSGNELELNQLADVKFNKAHENWVETGGKSLLVWHKGQLIYEAYADGILPSDRSRSFSMHKSILGLVAATMEADGLINLNDPISDYVDAYKKGGRESFCLLYTSPSPRD